MPGPIHRKYPKELEAAIFVLRWQARLSWSDTLAAIRNGEAGLDRAYDIPKATFNEKIRKLTAQHGDPRDYIAPAETVDAIREIERAALEISNKAVRELQSKSRAEGGLNANDLARVDKAVAIAQRLKTQPLKVAKRNQIAGGKAQQQSPVTALGSLIGPASDYPTSKETEGDTTSADSEASPITSPSPVDVGSGPSLAAVGDSHPAAA